MMRLHVCAYSIERANVREKGHKREGGWREGGRLRGREGGREGETDSQRNIATETDTGDRLTDRQKDPAIRQTQIERETE